MAYIWVHQIWTTRRSGLYTFVLVKFVGRKSETTKNSNLLIVSTSFFLLLVRHLLLVAMHLFLVANIVTTSTALVTSSDALVPSSEHCYY